MTFDGADQKTRKVFYFIDDYIYNTSRLYESFSFRLSISLCHETSLETELGHKSPKCLDRLVSINQRCDFRVQMCAYIMAHLKAKK